jgi:pimeloyl-ACP methyl ester carboxylesterase
MVNVISMSQIAETAEVEGTGGVRLRGDAYGPAGGFPVILLHGGGQTRHSWRTTARAMAEQGWRAWTFDLRGHGDSDWAPDGDYSQEAFAEDARRLIRSVPTPPAVVGASLGGISFLMAVGAEPRADVSAVVLVDVAPRIEESGARRIGDFMGANMEAGFGSLDEAADAIQAYNPHRPRPTDLEGLRKNLRQRPDGRWIWHWDPRFRIRPQGSPDETRVSVVEPERLEAAARSLDMPVLLVRGRMSDLLSVEGAQQFLTLAPHAEFVDVEGAGHMVAGDRNDVFNSAIVDFLGRLDR